MYLFVADFSWEGSISIVAESVEIALMICQSHKIDEDFVRKLVIEDFKCYDFSEPVVTGEIAH